MTSEAKRRYNKKYRESTRGKLAREAYNKSERGMLMKKQADCAYRKTEAGKAAQHRGHAKYLKTARGRESLHKRMKKYARTELGAVTRKRVWAAYCARPESRFQKYKDGAKARALVFDMTFEQFMTFWQKACSYCESPIDTIGLDRIDSATGYRLENVQPCCKICNRMKMEWPRDFFLDQCTKIAGARR